jgi:EAL domain-containing protein (putative c-di-GMP-specific phosphodiesterase class I)/GGDEF domain-containing protein
MQDHMLVSQTDRSDVTSMERKRVEALRGLHLLDTDRTEELDDITQLCISVFKVSTSYISLIDEDRQWVKAKTGVDLCAVSRQESFCTHTIEQARIMVIEDTLLDARFQANPLVVGPCGLRFYAGAPLLTPEGHAIGALCIVDVAPRQFSEDEQGQLQKLASLAISQMLLRRTIGCVDALTRMPNKYQLEQDLDRLARQPTLHRRVLAYLDMPDVGTASEIASVLGNQVHDDLIRNVAGRLESLAAERADVYHLAGARFALLSRKTEVEDFRLFLNSLTPALQAPVQGMTLPLNLPSYGGSVAIEMEAESLRDAPRKALAAVQRAVALDHRWVSYDADEDIRHQRTFHLLNDIPYAIGPAGGFALAYQPKLNLRSGRYEGAEALLRWQHGQLGAISPVEFIPLVEKTALIKPVTEWVIVSAFRQMAAWKEQGIDVKMAINLSTHNFEEEDICDRLEQACIRFDIDPRFIEVECTEGIWMHCDQVLRTLHEIRAIGMGLALDDFGTGYSNFSYLQEVPASVVKLDQSLIRNIHQSARDRRIVQSLIALAKELDYHIVAEGVETLEALELIVEWGCDEAQGYYLSRPLTSDSFLKFIQENSPSQKACAPGR